MTGADLTISPDYLSNPDLLAQWQWFFEEPYTVIIATKMGSLFLSSPTGSIHFFDPVLAKSWPIATDPTELECLFKRQDFILEYLQVEYLTACQQHCEPLATGQCYAHKLPLCIGGKDMPTNISPIELSEHLKVLGQLHAQINDLPEGSLVQLSGATTESR